MPCAADAHTVKHLWCSKMSKGANAFALIAAIAVMRAWEQAPR